MSNVSRILRSAASLIEINGLAKGQYEGEDGSLDIQEAIFQAATGIGQVYYSDCRKRPFMPITLNDHNRYRWSIITLRNWLKSQGEDDQPALYGDGHTQEEVVQALRACADHDEA